MTVDSMEVWCRFQILDAISITVYVTSRLLRRNENINVSNPTVTQRTSASACAWHWLKAFPESNSDDSGGASSSLEGAIGVVRKSHSNDTSVTPTTVAFVHLVKLSCSRYTSGLSKGPIQSCSIDRIGNEVVSRICHSHPTMQQDDICLCLISSHCQYSCKEGFVEKRRACRQIEAGHPERATPNH